MKIDVEGAEEKVLKGFGERLKEVDVVQIEWFLKEYHKDQMKLSRLMPLLEKYGFGGFVQKEVNLHCGVPSVCDLIFFRTDKI
ncbi:FkbM family methyltransferase [Candidatus Woesearchaeota archaeon]|nr:FkbM family methyltransferase [Candidatus Woesearchaeota archaeon]